MIRRLAAGLTAAICLGIGSPTPGEAAPVTFAFTGAVTQTMFDPDDPSGGEITFGTGFSGSYTFESTAADQISGGGSGSYASPMGAPYGFAVNFGPGHDFITSDALSIGVVDNAGGIDAYSVLACFGGFSCPDVVMELFLGDVDGSAITGDALPLDTLPFEAFEVAFFALRGLIDGNQVEILGRLSSLSCTEGCVAPQPVPEPGTLLLLTPALAAFGWRRRSRAAIDAMTAMRARVKKVPVGAGVCAIILSCFATNAFAVDGTVLIDQTRALAGGVTPSDSPGFPVTISRPGSYRLSGNLNVPADAAGIVIFASGVTIDFNGFQMIGSGVGTGISALQARRAIVVRNGSVTNFEKGIDIKGMGNDVRDMTAFGNSAIGLEIGPGATVSGNRVFSNGAGIRVESSSIVSDNAVLFNTGFGLRVAEGSVIRGNSAVQNGIGLEVVCPSALIGNTSDSNGQQFLAIGQSCTFANNNIPLP
jgi:parallel beta-helix repeat protein